jgi:hypothetical protein
MVRPDKQGRARLWIFSAGMSRKSEKRINASLSELRIHRWQSLSLAEVSRILSPKIRGVPGYFSLYGKSLMNGLWWGLNVRLVNWARRKFKLPTFGGVHSNPAHLQEDAASLPSLVERLYGMKSVPKSRVTGDCQARFREGLGVKFPRTTRYAPCSPFRAHVDITTEGAITVERACQV